MAETHPNKYPLPFALMIICCPSFPYDSRIAKSHPRIAAFELDLWFRLACAPHVYIKPNKPKRPRQEPKKNNPQDWRKVGVAKTIVKGQDTSNLTRRAPGIAFSGKIHEQRCQR